MNPQEETTTTSSSHTYTINRKILTQEVVNLQSKYEPYKLNVKEAIKHYYDNFNFFYTLKNFCPILKWLPLYSFRRDLVKDILSGFTVVILQVLQGMAYGMLAGLPPKTGLYMAFFPVLVYTIFGTSRHISVGAIAIVSFMTRDTIIKHAQDIKYSHFKIYSNSTVQKNFKNLSTPPNQNLEFYENFQAPMHYTNLEIATALAIATSIVHVNFTFIMALLNVGRLSAILSDPFVKGFTTALAFHIIVSQLEDMLGIKLAKSSTFLSHFKIVDKIISVAGKLPETNMATLIITICVIAFMVVSNEIINPYLSKYLPYLIPPELTVFIVSTLIFNFTSLAHDYKVDVVGDIPTGLPKPEFPPLSLINVLWLEAVELAFLIISVTVSMGILFGKKHSYSIEPNQELYALAIANFVGGCFSCMPSSSSVSRSVLQDKSGGVTQIASFVSAMFNLLVLLVIGPIFKELPKCILAAMVVTSLMTIMDQVKEVQVFAKQGKMELAMWSFTFFSTLIFSYVWGLIVGVITALFAFFMRSLNSYYCLLGTLPVANTGIYVCLDQHKTAVEIPNVKIFHYAGSVNFVTRYNFKKCILKAVNVKSNISRSSLDEKANFSSVILDLSAVAHLDASGCQILTEILKDLEFYGIKFFLASPSHSVYDALFYGMSIGEGPFVILPTLHDAVVKAKSYHVVKF